MEHAAKIIESLEDLKSKTSENAKNLLTGVKVIDLSELDKILKPFSDVEKQIDKSIKFLQSRGPIPKTSELNK